MDVHDRACRLYPSDVCFAFIPSRRLHRWTNASSDIFVFGSVFGVVRVRVQHHHRERQHVRLVGVLEVARVALAVARREPLDEPIDLLRLAEK